MEGIAPESENTGLELEIGGGSRWHFSGHSPSSLSLSPKNHGSPTCRSVVRGELHGRERVSVCIPYLPFLRFLPLESPPGAQIQVY